MSPYCCRPAWSCPRVAGMAMVDTATVDTPTVVIPTAHTPAPVVASTPTHHRRRRSTRWCPHCPIWARFGLPASGIGTVGAMPGCPGAGRGRSTAITVVGRPTAGYRRRADGICRAGTGAEVALKSRADGEPTRPVAAKQPCPHRALPRPTNSSRGQPLRRSNGPHLRLFARTRNRVLTQTAALPRPTCHLTGGWVRRSTAPGCWRDRVVVHRTETP